jgi:hypothetical protein
VLNKVLTKLQPFNALKCPVLATTPFPIVVHLNLLIHYSAEVLYQLVHQTIIIYTYM